MKIIKASIILLAILSSNIAYSYNFFLEPIKEQKFNSYYENKIENRFLANELPRNYDVLNYDLEVDWVDILPSTKDEPEKRKWNGKMRIVLTPLENDFSTIELDAVQLKINSILVNGTSLTTIPANTDGKLRIPLEKPVNPNDTIILVIDYVYNNPRNRGFCHRNTVYSSNVSPATTRPCAGTLSETNDARYWMPCNDRPSDKAIVTVKATVPYGMLAASNGILDSSVVNYKSDKPYSSTFYWRNTEPMPPYLITIAASEYTLYKEKIKVNSSPQSNDSVDFYCYIWEEDWEGTQYTAKRILTPTEKTMNIFSDIFGDYSYPKYGVAIVDYSYLGYSSLGMEHQTMTTASRRWIISYTSVPWFTGFAHELAHHWFGNLVTCNTWKDIWFQEGGATWLEAIYLEHILQAGEKQHYYNHMRNTRSAYMNSINNDSKFFTTPMYGLDDENGIFSYTTLVYSKASWIYHQLRELLGDEVIFPLVRDLLDKYKFSNISSEEFIDFFVQNVKNPPLNIYDFLSQWIYKAGHPKYSITSTSTPTDALEFDIDVTLEQTQNETTVPKTFLMPLEILCYKDEQVIHKVNVINNERKQKFKINTIVDIDSVSLNLNKSLLEIASNKHTSIIDNVNNNFKVYPNPLVYSNEINIEFPQEKLNQIKIVNVLGKNVEPDFEIINNDEKHITIKFNSLKSGFYLIQINDVYIEKLLILNNN